jgi:hypothetical protein
MIHTKGENNGGAEPNWGAIYGIYGNATNETPCIIIVS